MAVHSAHHFYNFNQLVSGFIAQNKKVTNNVHLMTFENLETCGNLWGNNSNSTHVDWWTAKHHFSRPRHKQDRNPRGPGMRIVVYTRNLLPVSRPRGQPSRYLKLSIERTTEYCSVKCFILSKNLHFILLSFTSTFAIW